MKNHNIILKHEINNDELLQTIWEHTRKKKGWKVWKVLIFDWIFVAGN
jgi:hypothetical protein